MSASREREISQFSFYFSWSFVSLIIVTSLIGGVASVLRLVNVDGSSFSLFCERALRFCFTFSWVGCEVGVWKFGCFTERSGCWENVGHTKDFDRWVGWAGDANESDSDSFRTDLQAVFQEEGRARS